MLVFGTLISPLKYHPTNIRRAVNADPVNGNTIPVAAGRQDLIHWLTVNDRNGSYTDDDMANEGWQPLTFAECCFLIAHQIDL